MIVDLGVTGPGGGMPRRGPRQPFRRRRNLGPAPPAPPWSGGDDSVPGPIPLSAGGGQLRAGQHPGILAQAAGGKVEGVDVVAPVGQQERVGPSGGVGRPRLDHRLNGLGPAVGGMDPVVVDVPGDRPGRVAGA
jgi:hypothetical protein